MRGIQNSKTLAHQGIACHLRVEVQQIVKLIRQRTDLVRDYTKPAPSQRDSELGSRPKSRVGFQGEAG